MGKKAVSDNGGRRSNMERRTIIFHAYVPERRCKHDRRSGMDRRKNRYEHLYEVERRNLADII